MNFGEQGLRTLSIGDGAVLAKGATWTPDGRLVVTGYATKSGQIAATLACFDRKGQLDPSFGDAGTVSIQPCGKGTFAETVPLTPEGDLILVRDFHEDV